MPTDSFSYTGSSQTWTAPEGWNGTQTVTVRLWGAGTTTRAGGYVEGELPVDPGEQLEIYVGEQGRQSAGGWPGGGDGGSGEDAAAWGGAGATDIRQGSYTLSDRVAVAGGAGGDGDDSGMSGSGIGGAGGPDQGEDATTPQSTPATGGTQTSGGAGEDAGTDTNGQDGSFGTGGDGGTETSLGNDSGGGGGGAGLYGGGGGGASTSDGAGGGAGGSNYDDGLQTVAANERGTGNTGDGFVEIEYTEPPAAPSGADQDVQDADSVVVSWVADTSGGPIDGYEVDISTDGGAWSPVATPGNNTTSITDTVDPAVNSIQYRVRAVNSVGTSNWTETAVVTTNATSLTVDAGTATSLDISWADPDANDGVDVLLAEASGSTRSDYTVDQSVGADVASATIDNLEPGEKYYIRVQATYTGDDGTPAPVSNEDTAVTDLPAPTLEALDASTRRELTLPYALNDNSSDGDVLIQRSTDGGSTWTDVATVADLSATAFVDTSLLDGEQYTYRVVRRTDHTQSQSGTQAATTILPGTRDLHVTNNSGDEIALAWNSYPNNGQHRVEVKPTDALTWTDDSGLLATSTTSDTTSALKDGERYALRVVTVTDHAETVGYTRDGSRYITGTRTVTGTNTVTADSHTDFNA